MYLAPGPAPEERRSFFVRTLQTLGLGATSIVLFVVAVGAYLVASFLVTTPQGLYHRAWQVAPIFIYDPNELQNWDQWKHKFDAQIKTNADAVKYANEMFKSLNDPFTHLHSAEEVHQMEQSASGKFAGVGIALGFKADKDGKPVLDAQGEVLPNSNADGYPVIDKVFDGGPAAQAGVVAGDAIKSADGNSLKDKNLTEVIKLLKGAPGTSVKVVIESNGVERTVDIARGVVNIPVVTWKRIGDVGYIKLDNFEQDTAVEEMRNALTQLKDTKKLVLDLRGNGGGRVDFCIDLVSMFLEDGQVVSIRNRVPFGGYSTTTYKLDKDGMTVEELDESTGGKSSNHKSREAYLAGGKEIVVLVNGHSASASEMFTGALKDNGRAVVVGEKTFGKGIGQMMLPMPNGTMLRITTLRYFTPNGTWLGDGSKAHHGIVPDHVVAPGTGFKPNTETDNQLDEAIKLLKGSNP